MKEKNLVIENALLILLTLLLFIIVMYGNFERSRVDEPKFKVISYNKNNNIEDTKHKNEEEEASLSVDNLNIKEIMRGNSLILSQLDKIDLYSATDESANTEILDDNDSTQVTYFGYSVSDEELILLAKLVNRESCYEPYEGQVAVAATVLNRLQSDGFSGNTIKEILYAPGQYDNGVPLESYSYNDENMQAALDAIAGYDPTKGAVFYYNPELCDDTWISTHIQSCVIGHHYFYFIYEK